VKLHIDANDVSEHYDSDEEPTNVAIIAYVEGSYFGDSDIFFSNENTGRDSTAIADNECHLLVLHRKELF
jgi:hypothetical protein